MLTVHVMVLRLADLLRTSSYARRTALKEQSERLPVGPAKASSVAK
jgi:hypothetical protein